MKKILFSAIILTLFSFATTPNKVEVKSSKITWKGYKVGSGHDGIVALKSGYFDIESGKIKGGKFVINMTSIDCTDLKGGWKTKINAHLKSDDFFATDKYPTSTLVFTKVKYLGARKYDVTADLSIKGITKPIKFELKGNLDKKYSATLSINRLEYNIKYNSGSFFENLGDKLIKDNFDVMVEVGI